MFQNYKTQASHHWKIQQPFAGQVSHVIFFEPVCCDALEVPDERIGASTFASWHHIAAIWSTFEWLGNLKCWFPVGCSYHYFVEIFMWSDDFLDCCLAFTFEHRTKTEKPLPPEKNTEKMQTFVKWTSTPKTPINSDADNFNIYFLQQQRSYPVKLQRYAIFQWKIPTPSWW